MKDLIKAIRNAANMNQEQFASSLGTTPLSINRWEKRKKTLPNRMAQTQLYNFFAKNVRLMSQNSLLTPRHTPIQITS